MATDNLVKQGSSASAATVLTQFPRNVPVLEPEGLNIRNVVKFLEISTEIWNDVMWQSTDRVKLSTVRETSMAKFGPHIYGAGVWTTNFKPTNLWNYSVDFW